MINIITSNILPIKSFKDYNDNFMITLLTPYEIIPYQERTTGYRFITYYQDGMELNSDNEYINDNTHQYEFIPVNSIETALDEILLKIIPEFQCDSKIADTEDDKEDTEINTIVSACDFSWNKLVLKYITKKLDEQTIDVDCLDLYSYLKIVKSQDLVKMLKFSLRTDFIYPDDPISFGFAISKILNQVM